MYILWLIFMALIVGYLAVPLARQLGYSYGRFGRFQDIVLVLIGTIVIGVLLVMALSALGTWDNSIVSGLAVGIVAAFVMVIILTLLSAKAAADEEPPTRRDHTPEK